MERRDREELERKKIDVNNRSVLLLKHIDVLLALIPRHCTTNCSDSNWASSYIDNGYPRCNRCFLLQAKKDNYVDNVIVSAIELKHYSFTEKD